MKLQLSTGAEFRVGLRYSWETVAFEFPTRHIMQCRVTTAYLRNLLDANTVEVKVTCSPQDQFCKRTGRKLAANRLLASLKAIGLPKEDRRKVFQALCPELRGKSS